MATCLTAKRSVLSVFTYPFTSNREIHTTSNAHTFLGFTNLLSRLLHAHAPQHLQSPIFTSAFCHGCYRAKALFSPSLVPSFLSHHIPSSPTPLNHSPEATPLTHAMSAAQLLGVQRFQTCCTPWWSPGLRNQISDFLGSISIYHMAVAPDRWFRGHCCPIIPYCPYMGMPTLAIVAHSDPLTKVFGGRVICLPFSSSSTRPWRSG